MVRWDSLSVAGLKEELRIRNLSTTGSKAELIQRLTETLQSEEGELGGCTGTEVRGGNEVTSLSEAVSSLADLVRGLQNEVRMMAAVRPDPNASTPVGSTALRQLFGDVPNETTSRTMAFHGIRDVIELLPEFDSTLPSALTAEQFVKRIQQLSSAYGWEDNVILFAVQTRLKGTEKLSIDSVGKIYESFDEFSCDLLREFPKTVNEADVHMRMMTNVRKTNEPVVEYFYKMCAERKRGGMSDAAIIQYIRKGLNHRSLQNATACVNFSTTNEFLGGITRFLANSPYIAELSQKKNMTHIFSESNKPETSNDLNKNNRDTERNSRVCYNCRQTGHISMNCPLPQRRDKYAKGTNMGNNPPAGVIPMTTRSVRENNIKQVNSDEIEGKRIVRVIQINGQNVDALIDPGSERTLIRESIANETVLCETIVLKGFAGGKFECAKKTNVELSLDKCKLRTDLFVVDDKLIPNSILLGADVLTANSVRTIIDSCGCRFESTSLVEIKLQSKLSADELEQFNKVIENFRECFAENIIEMCRSKTAQMKIELMTNKPIQSRPYRIPLAKRIVVEKILHELVAHNVIQHSDSKYSSPIVLVKKQNGEDRLCIDFRSINAVTHKLPHLMPTVEEILSQIVGNKYYTTLDLFSGYYQIPLDPNSRKYTAFVTHLGLFEFRVMPFGLVNAPKVFHEVVSKIVRRMTSRKIIHYMDEVIIACLTIAEGIVILEEFLTLIKEEGLTLRPSKCVFFAKVISFFGHNITEARLTPGSSKVEAVNKYPTPKSITDVRSFLGLTGFFRKFIREYALISRPLTTLLKGKSNHDFCWTAECQEAFNKLKSLLSDEPVLTLYNPNDLHELHTDASSLGLAAVLLQSSDQVTWKPVFCFSRQCNDVEKKYHSYELETLAVVEALHRLRFYLLGKHFRVVTDCSALSTTKLTTELNARIARWWLKLQELDFDIIHRAGNRMKHADALSRHPVDPPSEAKSVVENVSIVEINRDEWLITMQRQDPKLRDIIDVLMGRAMSPQITQLKIDYSIQNGRLMRRVGTDLKFVVPGAVRWRMVRSCHDDVGHVGCEKTLSRLHLFWFPRMRQYVKSCISACVECCYNKVAAGKRERRMFYEEIKPIPFRVLHIDHLGPFPRSRKGNAYVIAVTDPFSKYTILRAVRTTNAKSVVIMLNDITTFFGLPIRIISDRGSAFTSREFEEYYRVHDIHHVKIPVRTPRANGQVERVNQSILAHLRCSTNQRNDWDTILYMVQWSLNSQRHSTTQLSPNSIVFDFRLRDVTTNRMLQAVNDDLTDVPNESMIELRQKAADRIMQEKERWKQRFDKKHKKPYVYKEGDLVVIENVPSPTGESHKLEPKYKGPFIVSKVLRQDRYVIEDLADVIGHRRTYSSVYTSDKMKPWCQLSTDIEPYEEDEVQDENQEIGPIPGQERPSCQEHRAKRSRRQNESQSIDVRHSE